jgi:putative AlgH/UPF0301 family transcriptional regulator
LGYEFSILLSSKWTSSSGISVAQRMDVERSVDIAKSYKLNGSIFLGGKVDLSAGCYLKDADQHNKDSKKHLHAMRAMSTSLVELSLGFNIMQWL